MFKIRVLVALQVIALLFASVLAPAQAATVSTAELLATSEHDRQLAMIDDLLASQQVQAQFEALGVSPLEARVRVAALSPAELNDLAQHLEARPAGGSILGLLGAVFVVLLVLEFVGVTDVFSDI